MVKIRIMYWKEIPVQIEFSSSSTKKSVKLDERFQHAVDSISMKDGSYGSDDYLEGWQWVDKEEISQEFTEELINRYLDNYKFPQDLIKKISQLIDENSRSEIPGSLDEWILNN
ncbi:MAG: virulence factor [Chloroflexota bacterium]|nr:virulence factor [Chloroflexota bacterium]